MSGKKIIGVLLVFYESEEHLDSLFLSLKNQAFKNFKIYAIENSTTQFSAAKLSDSFLDAVILPHQGNIGFAKANNLLAERAIEDGCEYLLILNPDMELTDNTLETFVNMLERGKNIAACSSVLLFGNEKKNEHVIQLFGQKINYKTQQKEFLFNNQNLYQAGLPEEMEVDFVNGGSVFIRSEIVNQVGLFNEDYFMYNDEIDLAYRIKKINKKVVVSSVTKIYHNHDWTENNKTGYYLMYYYMMRNRVLFSINYKLYMNLVKDLFKLLITLPVTVKWLTGLADFKLVKYYYLGLWRGLIGETGKTNIVFK
jgi:GT2 family glycosyltransferase